MCMPPVKFGFDGREDDAPQEVPTGLRMQVHGATWSRDETPMLLHTFEYIARNAIVGWWKAIELAAPK